MELHPSPQWRIFHILTSEDIDDIISRLSHDSFSKLLLEMASCRFLKITEEDVKYSSDKQENTTTKKKGQKTFINVPTALCSLPSFPQQCHCQCHCQWQPKVKKGWS